jgi:hypothetical protein
LSAHADLVVARYSLVSQKRVSRTIYEYTLRAQMTNIGGPAVSGVTATLVSTPPGVTILDGELTFGDVAANLPKVSSDTFLLRHDRSLPLPKSQLIWEIHTPPQPGLSPASTTLRGQDAVTLSLQLASPAAAGGISVPLGSSDPNVATVPANLFVPGGESVAFFQASSTGNLGQATVTAGAASAAITVVARRVTVGLDAPEADLTVGENRGGKVTLADPAPAGGQLVSLSLGTPPRATLGTAQVTVAAGALTAPFSLTAAEAGAGLITAALSGAAADSDSFRFRIVAATTATVPSRALIESARAAGTISDEQAFVYLVLAAYGSPDLPAAYRGLPDTRLDAPEVRALPGRYASLSPAAQEAVRPYLFPPVYAGSWGNPAGVTAPTPVGAPIATAEPAPVCEPGIPGAVPVVPGWAFIQTRHFRVWHRTSTTVEMLQYYNHFDSTAAAQNVAAVADYVYETIASVFGTGLPSDGAEPCNGAGDSLDIYLHRPPEGPPGQVHPYPPGECGRPAWMHIAPDAALSPKTARNLLAHEMVHFWHVAQMRSDCGDPTFVPLDEMTASWAWDYVYPDDNFEHGDGALYFGGESDGEWRTRILAGNRSTDLGINGYADNPFVEWLSRTVGPDLIATINENTQFGNGAQALDLNGIADFWPRFALAAWNDYQEHVADDFDQWEHNPAWSVKYASIVPSQRFVEAKLEDSVTRDLKDEVTRALTAPVVQSPPLGKDILEPLSFQYLYVKFTDDAVRSVFITNPMYAQNDPRFRLQALQKVNGAWKPVENWTIKDTASYCRDKTDEHIEELVLIYSNAHTGEGDPATQLPPEAIGFGEFSRPEILVAAVGCEKWQGTVQYERTHSREIGANSDSYEHQTESATTTVKYKELEFPPFPGPLEPPNPLFASMWEPESASASWTHSGDFGTKDFSCSGSGHDTTDVGQDHPGSIQFTRIMSQLGGDDVSIYYHSLANIDFNFGPVYDCGAQVSFGGGLWTWWDSPQLDDPDVNTVTLEGGVPTLKGEFKKTVTDDVTGDTQTETWRWNLTQPLPQN